MVKKFQVNNYLIQVGLVLIVMVSLVTFTILTYRIKVNHYKQFLKLLR